MGGDAFQSLLAFFQVHPSGRKGGPEIHFHIQSPSKIKRVDDLLEVVSIPAAIEDDQFFVRVLLEELAEIQVGIILCFVKRIILVVVGFDMRLEPFEPQYAIEYFVVFFPIPHQIEYLFRLDRSESTGKGLAEICFPRARVSVDGHNSPFLGFEQVMKSLGELE